MPFEKGKVANPKGRPVGARQKLSEGFVMAVQDDWKEHGLDALKKMREASPGEYCRLVASLVPKEINLHIEDEFSTFLAELGSATTEVPVVESEPQPIRH